MRPLIARGMSLTGDTPQEFPPKLHIGSGNPPTPNVTIDNLPDHVLLEIFDLYRQTFGDQMFVRVWNNKYGWFFKLAQVCHNWRSVVLASPSRLRLRLYFTNNTPTSALALEHLSHLPIIIDYESYAWNPLENASTQERLISALRYKLRYPDRVCSIAIRGPYQYEIIEALDLPLPALECLEIDDTTSVGHTYLPMSMSLMTSIQSLRHVRLAGKPLTSFFPILSVTRAIIDLTLNIDTVLCSAKGASLLTHLQYMPQLRNLQVETQSLSSEEMEGEEMEGEEMPSIMSILLAELTYVRFRGECAEIEWIMAGLVTPSLREFHITAYDDGTLHIPYLFEFIRVADIVVSTARLSISRFGFAITLFAHPHSIEDLTFKIVTVTTPFLANPSGAPSAMLGTIEDIFFSLGDNMTHHELLLEDLVSWREFFEEFRNVKVLRLCHCLDTQVVDILRLLPMNSPPSREGVDPDAITPLSTPINSNGSQSLGIFPLLEEIVVYATKSDTRIDEKERASVLESFVPFTTARHEAGRPVKVFWNTDGVFPRCFRM